MWNDLISSQTDKPALGVKDQYIDTKRVCCDQKHDKGSYNNKCLL